MGKTKIKAFSAALDSEKGFAHSWGPAVEGASVWG